MNDMTVWLWFPSQIGVAPLADNDPEDKYLYEVAVFTGMRRNAGTTSNVSQFAHYSTIAL